MSEPKVRVRAPARKGVASEVPFELADLRLAKLRELATKLQFTPTEGRIWLQDRRMVLLYNETMATLRAELIESLGLEATRGVITRLGYTTGCRDAELAWKLAGPGASVAELLDIGILMRSLQGFAVIEPVGPGAGEGGPLFETEWIVKESIEDEAHIASHGIGTIPACWAEVGYATGYLSTFAGKRILAREVECRALGHAQCRIVAKPIDQWADAEEDLQYLEKRVTPAPTPPLPAARSTPRRDATPPETPTGLAGTRRVVGASAAYSMVLHKISRVAPTNATVLLLGESGTGKSMFAREVHKASQRAAAPFIEVNCAAIPEQLIESELFGVERGAYSGATTSRAGRFEIAHGGTIFLDEIAALSLTAQGKLLRVLQSGELERLGSTATIHADARVVAATNEDLRIAVKEGRFREDLFYRLNVFPIAVQPLRERRDDILPLAELFRVKFNQRHQRNVPGITTRAVQAMLLHQWPGNIRELENVIERGVILAQDGAPIDIHHLFSVADSFEGAVPLGLSGGGALVSRSPLLDSPNGESAPGGAETPLQELATQLLQGRSASLAAVEEALVRAALQETKGNISAAAGRLGLTRAQLDYRVKKLSA